MIRTDTAPPRTGGDGPRPVLPYDPHLEEAFLGALLHPDAVAPESVAEAIGMVRPEDLGSEAHAAIYNAILGVHARTGRPDAVLVAAELRRQAAGRALHLLPGVLADVPTPTNLPVYAAGLAAVTRRRRIVLAATDLADAARGGGDTSGAAGAVTAALRDDQDGGNPSRVIDGAVFILDETTSTPIWGKGQRVLVVVGECTFLVGPDGVGKTTLALQYVLARMGIIPELLGLPVQSVGRRVALVAADRPGQIRRRLAQMVSGDEHVMLRDRLVVHRGTLPFDITERAQLVTWTGGCSGMGDPRNGRRHVDRTRDGRRRRRGRRWSLGCAHWSPGSRWSSTAPTGTRPRERARTSCCGSPTRRPTRACGQPSERRHHR